MIKIKAGLDLPIKGSPRQQLGEAPTTRTVALLGADYPGMKPTMLVREGDRVKLGQPLFSDKKNEGVLFTAPGAGTVTAIHRGERRVFQSVVIELDADEEAVQFAPLDSIASASRESVVSLLVESGLWTAIRKRPFEKIPAITARPHSIFVTAMDTHPLAGDPLVSIQRHPAAFQAGLDLLARLTDGSVYVCAAEGAAIAVRGAQLETFAGPHPAGLVGTHIHYLDPIGAGKEVWHIQAQDVIAMGVLATDGQLFVERVVALAGPSVADPRLIATRLGANLDDVVAHQLVSGTHRVISGSVLGGRSSAGLNTYLGRYHTQISCVEEGTARIPFGWLTPGVNKHSVMGIYISSFRPKAALEYTTNTNGSPRAMVPVGAYEKVMPLDILPTQLLRALIVGDTDTAVKLGALELAEEDLALCTYVCPGKYEYGPILRDNLTTIELEG